MLNPNKISEIKIIIDQLVKDIDSLDETELVSPLKWEELFIATSLIKEKIRTLKTEQERLYYKHLISELNELDTSVKAPLVEVIPFDEPDISLEPAESIKPVETVDPIDPIERTEATEILNVQPEVIFKTPVKDESEVNSVQEKVSGKEQFVIEVDNTLPDDSEDGELEFDFTEDFKPVNDAAKSVIPEWMRDIPGPMVEDIHHAVTLNDKLFFIRELFKGDEDQYRLSLQRLNDMSNMKEALEYTRNAFTHWDEESNAVYRFYMLLRRRYNG